jgi:hypothetical protein
MEILSNVEAVIGIEKALACFITFTIAVVPPYIPLWGRSEGVVTEVIRNVSDYKLCLWYSVSFEILEVVVE